MDICDSDAYLFRIISYRITLSIISVMEMSTDQTWRFGCMKYHFLEFVYLSPRKQQCMNCLLYTLNCHNDI